MGAYENPPLIRDRSAEIWAQLGDITPITTAITAAQKFKYDERIKYEEEVKKRNKEISAVNIKARLTQTEEVMKQYNVLKETDSSLADQYLEEMKLSMNGRGKPGDKDYVLGTIDAETKLITDTDLSSEQQGDLTNYIIGTKAYAKNNITLAAANKIDADEIEKIGKGEYGNRYVYMGKNEKEQFTAQALSNAMNRNGDVGFRVDSSKTIYKNSKGKNGEAIIDFQFAMDKNEFEETAAYKKILADGEELPELKDGQYIFKFNGDQNKLKNGLVIDLGEAKDLQKTYLNKNILNQNKSGDYTFSKTAFIGKGKPHIGIGRVSNLPGKESMTTRKFLNMDAINNINFESDAAYVLGDGSDENILKVLNGRYGIPLDEAREILENNDEEGLGEILKKEAEKTMLGKTFWMKGDELSKSEIDYFRENGITVNPEERYYFEGTDYKIEDSGDGSDAAKKAYLLNKNVNAALKSKDLASLRFKLGLTFKKVAGTQGLYNVKGKPTSGGNAADYGDISFTGDDWTKSTGATQLKNLLGLENRTIGNIAPKTDNSYANVTDAILNISATDDKDWVNSLKNNVSMVIDGKEQSKSTESWLKDIGITFDYNDWQISGAQEVTIKREGGKPYTMKLDSKGGIKDEVDQKFIKDLIEKGLKNKGK